MDKVSKKVRSRIMSSIHGKDTKPELALRRELFSNGLRYRKNYRLGDTRVDIAFVGKKVVVFVDGCFWHGCPTCYREPKSNRRYWVPKIHGNVERDLRNSRILRKSGWRVIRIWEHELDSDIGKSSAKVIRAINR